MAEKKKNKKPAGANANSKRATLPKRFDYTRDFQQSWDRYNQTARYDMTKYRAVMAKIIAGEELGPEYRNHELEGKRWAGCWECHVGGDYLLVYRFEDDILWFVDLGTHSELFGR